MSQAFNVGSMVGQCRKRWINIGSNIALWNDLIRHREKAAHFLLWTHFNVYRGEICANIIIIGKRRRSRFNVFYNYSLGRIIKRYVI